MKLIIKILVILFSLILIYEVAHLVFIRDMNGWAILSWIESVPENGPSTKANAEDIGSFSVVESFKGESSSVVFDFITIILLAVMVFSAYTLWVRSKKIKARTVWKCSFILSFFLFFILTFFGLRGSFLKTNELSDSEWKQISDRIKIGDVIAYSKEKWSARRELLAKGKATVIGYRLFKYGHLAIVVEDPEQPGRKVLFTSQGQKGVNIDEDIDSLRKRNWESWRLDKWDRIDIEKINQGVKSCREKSGHFFGYDYSGMFSIWNENLKPETVKDFGDEYICSTAVVTLLYFGGFESDSTPRQELDLITPFQVVRAKGAFIDDDPKPKD